MVGRILPEREELKVGTLTKKSQNKSYFFSNDNYNVRVFVLDTQNLTYYSGTVKKWGEEKGVITLQDITAVETLQDKRSQCGFQVSYESDGRPLILYITASSKEERDEWINAIRAEALNSGAYFILTYHPVAWDRKDGFSCCGAPDRGDEGCMPVTKQTAEMRERLLSKASSAHAGEIMTEMMTKRSQGKSTFFGATNYKDRVFVLDSRSLRYFSGNLRVVYENDDDESVTLVIVARSVDKRQAWVKAIRQEAQKNAAALQSHCHEGVWVKGLGKYNCCHNTDRDSQGCQPVTVDTCQPKRNGAGGRVGSSGDVKVGKLTKRAQFKSSFYVSKTFRQRLFVLNNSALRYFSGKKKKQGSVKGSILLGNILVVATLKEGVLDGRNNAFQVAYIDEEDGQRYLLYLVASGAPDRLHWINAITAEAIKAGAQLSQFHHCGIWMKNMGKFSCCSSLSRDAEGCIANETFDSMPSPSPRPQSSSSFSSSSSSSDDDD